MPDVSETQRHAVMSLPVAIMMVPVCGGRGDRRQACIQVLAGTEPAKSLVDLSEPDSADV